MKKPHMPKTAIVDIDNTLWQFCDPLYKRLREINGDFPTVENWTDWNLWEGYCSAENFFGAVNAIHLNQDDDRHLPYTEAKGFLSSLRENGYHITIASHRSPDYRKQTERWLHRHGLVYDDLHLSFHKTRLFNASTHVVVDDAPQVLEKAAESGARAMGLLFPWNKQYSDNGFGLCANLTEVLSHILDS